MRKDFILNEGQNFKDEKRDFSIIQKLYIKDSRGSYKKWYKYKCNKCTYEGKVREYSLLKQKTNCQCCTNQVAVLGINTIWDTDRWMCDLGVSEEDAKKYTKGSSKKIKTKCPNCNKEKESLIANIYKRKSIGCNCSSKGVSYCERFFKEFLSQLKINFEFQLSKKTFSWIGKYKYDFYFELNGESYIIETHGEQHYRDNTNFSSSLKEVKSNDLNKKNLAKCNGIDNYIIINCCKSDREFIKKSILNSDLNKLNLKNVDWVKCEEFALDRSIFKEVCQYWDKNKECKTTRDLAKKFNISHYAIWNYLKQGNQIGICEYNSEREREKAKIKASINAKVNYSKKVEIFKNNISLGVFISASELERQSENKFGIKLNHSCVSRVARGERKQYKGFTFKYAKGNQTNKAS